MEIQVLGPFAPFRDADQISARATPFFIQSNNTIPTSAILAELSGLCGGEVEAHLHHEQDTPESLPAQNCCVGRIIWLKHNPLATDQSGNLRYAFIHGNWAPDDSHPAGEFCGGPN